MGFNRTSRAGQVRTLPALCCTTYQGRIHAAISGAALAAAEGLADDAAVSAMESASTEAVGRIIDEHRRFADHLDPAILTTDLDGVASVTIRGLSGAQLGDAETAGKLAAIRAKAKDPGPFVDAELCRAGLVAVDGFDEAPGVNGYPVEVLSGPGGMAEWSAFRPEFAARIRTWSILGESVLSPSGP